MKRCEISSVGLLPCCSLSQTGCSDILFERILSLYFPGIQILLDTNLSILHHHQNTSTQIRGFAHTSERCRANMSQMEDMLITQSMPASPKARSNQLEAHRSTKLQVIPDFCDYCLEVLDRLTKNSIPRETPTVVETAGGGRVCHG